jgi:hypothetical protein
MIDPTMQVMWIAVAASVLVGVIVAAYTMTRWTSQMKADRERIQNEVKISILRHLQEAETRAKEPAVQEPIPTMEQPAREKRDRYEVVRV